MDLEHSKTVIEALASGIDPTTGELLPENHVCNNVEVVRALYSLLQAVDKSKSKNDKNKPENAGKPWTEDDDKTLCEMFEKHETIKNMSEYFKRTRGSITSRLVKLGKINSQDEFMD